MTIYDLKLHESSIINTRVNGLIIEYRVIRVPGGWIYRNVGTNYETFVPFNNDCQ